VPAGLRQLAVVGHRARKGGIVGLNRFKARIRHLWNWSIAQGYADASPFKRHGVVVIGTDSRAETERTRRLSPQEEDRLVAAANPRLRGLIIAALSTGCRRGELLALRWADVQIDAKGTPKTITLSGSRTKTGQPRVLPIGPRLRAVLTMRTTDLAGEPLPPTAYVFGNEVGEEMPSIREAWARACAKAGIADLHFHDLRREFACRLLESRAELHDVRDFLGHSNISMTSRYLHATPLRLERALGLLEAAEAERIRKPFANGADQPIAADDESDLTGETVTLKN
jgi:integrase